MFPRLQLSMIGSQNSPTYPTDMLLRQIIKINSKVMPECHPTYRLTKKRQFQFNPSSEDNNFVYHTMETAATNPTPGKYFDNACALCLIKNRYLYSHDVIYRDPYLSNTTSDQQPKRQHLSTSSLSEEEKKSHRKNFNFEIFVLKYVSKYSKLNSTRKID